MVRKKARVDQVESNDLEPVVQVVSQVCAKKLKLAVRKAKCITGAPT